MNNEIYLTLVVFTIAIIFISYTLYNYYTLNTETVLTGYTYLPKNLASDDPIARIQVEHRADCADQCVRDTLCDGYTYDTDSQMCTTTHDGLLRKDNNNNIAWEKTEMTLGQLFIKTLLAGYISTDLRIAKVKLPSPSMYNNCMFSFWVHVRDHYKNFEFWKHVIHKGTEPDGIINYRDWDDLAVDFPDQYIGAWLAPFTNNLRICITTIQNDTRQLEYYDLLDVPINKAFFVGVVIKEKYLEIYTDGKLQHAILLVGEPEFNNGDLFIKYDKTFNGSLYNVNYMALPVGYTEVLGMYDEKPRME